MGLWGDPNVTGKPVGSDLARRKKTFPVVAALGSGTEAAASLAQLYGAEEPMSADEVRQAIDLVETAGGRKAAERQADECIGAALAALPDSARSEDLIALTQLVIARDR